MHNICMLTSNIGRCVMECTQPFVSKDAVVCDLAEGVPLNVGIAGDRLVTLQMPCVAAATSATLLFPGFLSKSNGCSVDNSVLELGAVGFCRSFVPSDRGREIHD